MDELNGNGVTKQRIIKRLPKLTPKLLEARSKGGSAKTERKIKASRKNCEVARASRKKASHRRKLDEQIVLNRKSWILAKTSAEKVALDDEMNRLINKRDKLC